MKTLPHDLRRLMMTIAVVCAALYTGACLQAQQLPDAPMPGTIAGVVTDVTGAAIVGASARLTRDGGAGEQNSLTDGNGRYEFVHASPGAFHISIEARGFTPQTIPVILSADEAYNVPQIVLEVAASNTEVRVTVPQIEIAQEQIQIEEKQRVLGFIPNFYVSYSSKTVPLTPKQKTELFWKSTIDPVNFAITGIIAGVQQANNDFSGFGQGAAGYSKRYWASYGTFLTGNLIGGEILPIVLKQDPRYYYKGTGTIRSRTLYAIANSVVRKGDNGHWQPDYSGLLGGLAASGISNFYYPAANRDGAELTFQNFAIGIAGSAVGNLFQEFLVRKLTPHAGHNQPDP